jgi:Domain of unknown function (DUF4282)
VAHGAASGSVNLLFGAVGALLGLLFVRVGLELTIVIFKILEALKSLAD